MASRVNAFLFDSRRPIWGESLVWVVSASLGQNMKPTPPGIRGADKQPGPADIPPMERKSTRPSPELMQAQARELSAIAQTIPSAVSQLNQGILARDMNEKLKRIEKLSKTLHSELNP